MFRSFFLRIMMILSTTAAICLLLMAMTLAFQHLQQGAVLFGLLFGLVFIWLLLIVFVIRRIDPEVSVEVARLAWPAGALLSIVLSILLAYVLEDMIPGNEGNQHFILIFVGVGVALFLSVRCFDIKYLRLEEEIAAMEEPSR